MQFKKTKHSDSHYQNIIKIKFAYDQLETFLKNTVGFTPFFFPSL